MTSKEPTLSLGVEAFNPIRKGHNKAEAGFETAFQLFEKFSNSYDS